MRIDMLNEDYSKHPDLFWVIDRNTGKPINTEGVVIADDEAGELGIIVVDKKTGAPKKGADGKPVVRVRKANLCIFRIINGNKAAKDGDQKKDGK